MPTPPSLSLPRFLRKPAQAVGTAIAALLLWSAASSILSDPASRIEGILSDFRNQAWMVLHGPSPEDFPSPVTVVDVDERTLQELGLYGESYRRYHAGVVDFLSRNGAGAIVFDVLFKESRATQEGAKEIESTLRQAGWKIPSDSQSQAGLRRAVDVSALLESAVGRSGRTIVAAQLGDHLEYPNPSDWIPRARKSWQESIWNDGLRLPAPALASLRGRNTLDNIYPALAHRAERLALANIEPDIDGSVRRIQLLWRFPDTSFVDPVLAPEGTAPARAYPALSLATTMRLFGRRPDELRYKPGKWIDLGAPLRIWRDPDGDLRTSAPELSWAMCEGLRAARKSIDSIRGVRGASITVAHDMVFHRLSDGGFSISLDYPDSLDDPMVRALASLPEDTSWWSEVPVDGSPAALSDLVAIRRTTEGFGFASLVGPGDLEHPPRLELETDAATLRHLQSGIASLRRRFPVLDSIPIGKREAFSNALEVQWDRTRDRLTTPYLALRGSSLEELLGLDSSRLARLAPGDTISLGDAVRLPVDSRGAALLSFPAPSRWLSRRADESWIRHVSYVDVLRGRLDPGLVAGRVFVLGSSAIAMADFVDTPIEQRFPGVNIQALGIQLWASGDVLRQLPSTWIHALPIAMALLAGFLAAYLAPVWALASSIALVLTWFGISLELFQSGWWTPLLEVFAPLAITTAGMVALRYLLEEREKQFLQRSFKTYIAPELIDQMIESGEHPRLGGEEREITAFFSDIQAFSTFTEVIGSPARLVDLLNEYLGALTGILTSNKGTLDKYIGDAIVAMFGAPVRVEDHARRAVETAVAMQETLAILRRGWQNQGEAWPEIVHHMRTRIGLNSGPAVTGNMGSQLRMNYTMMGDTVNLAARLESGAKQYGAFVVASDSTVRQAGPGYVFRELDRVRVVGRSEPVVIHEVLGRTGDTRLEGCAESFHRARALYIAGDFAAARDGFRQSLALEPHRGEPFVKTTPSQVFLDRSEAILLHPPRDWDGIHTASEK